MPSGLSETQIYNATLDRLAEAGVLSTTDDKAVARWLNRNYPIQRDVLLQRHPWNFAVKRASLAADSDTPAFEWQYQYTIPSDCLRVLPITCDGKRNSTPIPFVVEGNKILTNQTAPLKMRYIFQQTNPAFFTPVFADLLAQILAAMAAHWITGKASFAKQVGDLAKDMMMNAQLLDSLEGLPEEPVDDDVVAVR